MKPKRILTILLLVIVIFVTTIACGSSKNVSTKVGEMETQPPEVVATEVTTAPIEETEAPAAVTEVPTEAPKLQDKYSVGDVIKLPSQVIVLTSAEFTNNMLVAKFAVGNTSSEFFGVSSIMSFSARNADGTTLEQDWFNCGPGLDGELAPGDKLKGEICWTNATPGTKIYYEENLFSTGAVVWEVNESKTVTDTQIPEIDDLKLSIQTETIGNEIALNGEKIILNSAEINNGFLKTNFTISNTGTEEITVSSMVSFSARSADGVKLDQEIFDCGSGPDGSVQPGDLIRGEICWSNATSGTRIYYSSGLLSTEYVVWIIE